MAHIIITRRAQLSTAVNTESLPGLLYAGENDAHVFIISAVRGDTPVTLAGAVTALFMRPDESTVALSGEIVNGCASVTLPQSCYTQTGRFQLTVFVTENGVKTAVYCLSGNVKKTTTETIIDPGHVVPDVDDIIAEYATMQQAVEDCEDAAEAANTAASAADAAAANVAGAIADAYSASATYAVGDYCTKDGKLYRCVTAISTAEAWTAAHWAEVTAMGEVVEITGALSDKLQDVSDNQIIETTEAAAFAYIPDAAKAAAKGVDITIKPAQAGSGDPSPTNIRAISGWTEVKLGRTGKNMLPKMTAGTYTYRGVTAVVDANGVATFSGMSDDAGNFQMIIPLDGSFTIPHQGLVYQLRNSIADGNVVPTIEGTTGSLPHLDYSCAPANRMVTLPDNRIGTVCSQIRFYTTKNHTVSLTFAPSLMVEAGDHVPNDGQNSLQTIAFPSEAGTVYGGTLHINEDGSGVLTVTHGLFTLTSAMASSLDHGYHATYGAWIKNLNYNAGVSRKYYSAASPAGLCPSNFSAEVHLNNHSISSSQLRTSFKGAWTSYDEFAAAIAALEEQSITPSYVALLETPATYTLTAEQVALLKGANTIYADAGDTAVEYVADTKAYIDNKFAELQALILENI